MTLTTSALSLQKLAENLRLKLGFVGETPIANDIFLILDKLKIYLLEYPIKSDNGDIPAFSAVLIYSTAGDEKLTFIGLNTADYFDRQIFAIAHELYHFETKTGSHLSRLSEDQDDLTEIKANRFAAEFLLPEKVLEDIVVNEFKTSNLHQIKIKSLLRFIARLHCTWWLPYRSIVKRLKEIDAISAEQYKELFKVNERAMNSDYGHIGFAINEEVFKKLNTATYNIGTTPYYRRRSI